MPFWIKPAKLQPGDKVATISLSWGGAAVFPERYALGKKRLQDHFGLEVVETRHALRDPAWLKANPKARADDLMEAFADPSIKGIISIIGGNDSVRLLPFIDFDVIAQNPKVFIGYSDTTVAHFMCLKAGLSSFYGPSVLAEFAENVACFPYAIEAVKRTLFSDQPIGVVEPNREGWTGERLEWGNPANAQIRRKLSSPMGPRVLQGKGVVSGSLIGGCIEVMEFLRGTPLWPETEAWRGAILVLETSEENPPVDYFRYWVRGYASMGILDQVAGIILGRPMCEPAPEILTRYDVVLQSVVRDECGLADLPIMTQMDFGHSSPQFVLPLGQRAEIHCESGAFVLPEAAVSGRKP